MGELQKALRSSVHRLGNLVEPLERSQLVESAYPEEWSVADVLSHIGSGAVITQRRLEDGLAGHSTPDDFAQGVWDEWNTKDPEAQAQTALVVDRALMEKIDSVTEADQARFRSQMGPLTLDFTAFVGMRLSEHALHTWDIEVVGDPVAALPEEAAAELIDRLDLIARFTGRPTGADRRDIVRTSQPEREFAITLATDRVQLESITGRSGEEPLLELPAEAFVRLIYGRLDADHTPTIAGDQELLDHLRRAFPGP